MLLCYSLQTTKAAVKSLNCILADWLIEEGEETILNARGKICWADVAIATTVTWFYMPSRRLQGLKGGQGVSQMRQVSVSAQEILEYERPGK